MKRFYSGFVIIFLLCGCSQQGGYPEQGPAIREAAGSDRQKSAGRATVYGANYTPLRNFESSVLNEADQLSTNQVRVNGSGYGHKR